VAKQLQLRRGSTLQHSTFKGAIGEITVDTDKDVLVVHDGITNGGFPQAKASEVTASLNTKVDKNANITAGTATKITYDSKGLVVTGESLSASDIPNLDVSKITTGTLPVERGGTGTTTSTGTGSVVRSASPELTGSPTAPTQAIGDNSTRIATTAYVDRATLPINSLRADKYLASLNIVNMLYTNGDLTKIRYNNDTDVNYEVLGYTSGDLTTIQHYIGSVLKGTTTLSYSDGNLVSAVFVAV
jgi:hypothetical protein